MGYASLLRQKRSRKPAFVAVKAADRARNKTAVHRFRAASFAGALCVKRTAKNRWTDQKMNAFIFWLAIGFSYARKLSLRLPSYRRRLFVVIFKSVRSLRSRRRILLAQRFGGRGGLQRLLLPCQFLFYAITNSPSRASMVILPSWTVPAIMARAQRVSSLLWIRRFMGRAP